MTPERAATHRSRPQRQDSLAAQIRDLRSLAVENGLYDAADWLDRLPFALHTRSSAVMRRAKDALLSTQPQSPPSSTPGDTEEG